jgi:proteasome lid subunit RPN8/RPN11
MSKGVKIKIKAQPAVVLEAEVARKIRQHARSSMKAEVCGVLLGTAEEDRTLVEACIAGINAAQGGAHVTFTQDTWEHIYKIKDQQYPEMKIVGWYHSHPGFGVFLSEHDLFIQENFFSSPQQIAWVYDPHTDEEGCFGWVGGKIEKLPGIRFGYSQSVEMAGAASEDKEAEDGDPDPIVGLRPARADNEPAWVKWVSQALAYVAVLGLGFAMGYMFLQWRWGPVLAAYEQRLPALALCEQIVQHPVEACNEILRMAPPSSLPSGPQIPESLKPSQPLPNQEEPAPGKGTNGKH